VDPGERMRLESRDAARNVFRREVDPEGLSDVLADMSGQLATLNGRFHLLREGRVRDPRVGVECGDAKDPECGQRLGYVKGNRLPITLCPGFFKATPEERARTMVHESAHAVGIGDSGGESYFGGYVCGDDGVRATYRIGRTEGEASKVTPRTDWADAWSLLVTCLTGPGDPVPGLIQGSP